MLFSNGKINEFNQILFEKVINSNPKPTDQIVQKILNKKFVKRPIVIKYQKNSHEHAVFKLKN